MSKKTIVINFTGGPGAGKSFMATRLVSNLKERGVSCEYVPEFAKDLVWEGRLSELNDQLYVLANQNHMLLRVKDKVNVIVVDSPIILSMYYNKISSYYNSSVFDKLVLESYNNFDNIVYYVERNHPYVREGRYQTEEESDVACQKIKQMLDENNINYQTIVSGSESAEKITDFVVKLLQMYGNEKKQPEYERKFLLKSAGFLKLGFPKKHIVQNYLNIGQTEKRLRKVGSRYFFTEKHGSGDSRIEYEKEITKDEYNYFLTQFAKGKTIEKDRYYINLENTKSCEVNLFSSPKPIRLIEVEFDSEESMQAFNPPKWFGREVTSDGKYYNHNIACENS